MTANAHPQPMAGAVLPPPAKPFGGTIGTYYSDSEPDFAEVQKAPRTPKTNTRSCGAWPGRPANPSWCAPMTACSRWCSTSTRSASCGRLATTSIALGPQDRAALDALVAKGRSTLITGQMLRTLTGGLGRRAALARA